MKGKIYRTRLLVMVGMALVVLVAGATWALAQTEGVINACVNASDGTLRIVAEPVCKNKEVLLSWNIMGPKGDPGLACWDRDGDGVADPEEDINGDAAWDTLDCQGPQGEQGIQGQQGLQSEQGPQAETGPAGPASLEALHGTACTVGGHPGTVELAVAADGGAISLTCVVSSAELAITNNLIHSELVSFRGSLVGGVTCNEVEGRYTCGADPGTANLVFELGSTVTDFQVYERASPATNLFSVTCPDGITVEAVAEGSYWVAACADFVMDDDKSATITPSEP